VAAILAGLFVWSNTRPPAEWSRVTVGMDRTAVDQIIRSRAVAVENTEILIFTSRWFFGSWRFELEFRNDKVARISPVVWRWN
jgi:hypothetical protein